MIQSLPKIIKRIETKHSHYPIIVEYPVSYDISDNGECTIHYTSDAWKQTIEMVVAKDYDCAEVEMKKRLSNKFKYRMGEKNVMWAKKL